MTLRAVTVPLGRAGVDPLTSYRPGDILVAGPGVSLLGVGTALEVSLATGASSTAGAAVGAALAAVGRDPGATWPGAGPVAMGALPFERAPAVLVVPRLVLGRDGEGRTWLTAVVGGDEQAPDAARALAELEARSRPLPAGRPAPSAGVPAPMAGDEDDRAARFTAMVFEALAAIGRGELAKVVLSRSQVIEADPPVDLASALVRWRQLDPAATVFAVPTGAGDHVFAGASPELLVARRGTSVTSRPLAGTAPRGADPRRRADLLRHSEKDAAEHRIVVEAVTSVLARWCAGLDVPPRPTVIETNGVSHLATEITGLLRPGGVAPSALGLAAALHPTPAVGGTPTQTALRVLADLEDRPRRSYAGPVGWVDAGGDGDWVVGIRAALLGEAWRPGQFRRVELTAGVGIVRGSDPGNELAETELKLDSIRRGLFPPEPAELSNAG